MATSTAGQGSPFGCHGHHFVRTFCHKSVFSDQKICFLRKKRRRPPRTGAQDFCQKSGVWSLLFLLRTTKQNIIFEYKSAQTPKTSESLRKNMRIPKKQQTRTRRHATNTGNPPSPRPNAPRDKISRSGEPLTPILYIF